MNQPFTPTPTDEMTDGQHQWNRRSLLRGLSRVGVLGAAVAAVPSATAFAATDDGVEELVVPTVTREDLTTSDLTTAGRIVRLADDDRSLWLDTGSGWISLSGGVFNVRAFGAVGDGVADDWSAFQTAIEAMASPLLDDSTTPYGRTLIVPPGRYRLAQTLVLNRAIHLLGLGRAGDAVISPDPGLVGVIVQGGDVLTGGAAGRAATGAIIEGVRLEVGPGFSADDPRSSSEAGDAAGAHGLWLKTQATVRDCAIVGFQGNGIHIEAAVTSANDSTQIAASAADGWTIHMCLVSTNAGHGLFTTASGGSCSGLEAIDNSGWGIADESVAGNTYLQCRASANDAGPIQTIGEGNRSVVVGFVSESGQPTSTFDPQTIIVGGRHDAEYVGGNAWTANGSRISLLAQTPGTKAEGDTAPTLAIRSSDGQIQPHLVVTNLAGQRQAMLDILGRLSLGPIGPDDQSGGSSDGANLLLHLSGGPDGNAGLRWLLADDEQDFVGWVAQARAHRDAGGPDAPNAPTGFGSLRLTFQTPSADETEVDTLTLRNGAVGVGTNAPAAALDVTSTTSGFLPPRLSSEQRDAIVAPAAGSVIYNTSSKRLNTFDGGAWREEGGLLRLTADERDQIDAPGEGTMIYNLTSKRLNFYDGSDWREVAVAQPGN